MRKKALEREEKEGIRERERGERRHYRERETKKGSRRE